jgi:uridylate kinase
MMFKKTIVISLGGSLVVPDQINVTFLKKFRSLILSRVRRGERFIIIVGGGKIACRFQSAANKITKLQLDDIDWLGIHATRLNAHLLRTLFRDVAHPQLITAKEKMNSRITAPVVIAAGFRPGSSTDYCAVLLAHAFDAKRILNLSNIDWAYTKDPKKHKDAKLIKEISWKAFRKIVGNTWNPGANVPFDPVASRWAQRYGMTVVITRGTDIANLSKLFSGRKAKGTVVG